MVPKRPGNRCCSNRNIFLAILITAYWRAEKSRVRETKAPVTLYRSTFRSGLIFTTMGKIAVFALRRCAPCHPTFFCITISNASKFRGEILRNSTLAPEVLAYCTGAYRIVDYTWHFPVRHIPNYFSYHQQSGVIFAPRHIPDYSGVM